MATCVGCEQRIVDQYLLRVAPDMEWHASCLRCNDCRQFLDEFCTCFIRDGKTYCKQDYIRYTQSPQNVLWEWCIYNVWGVYMCMTSQTPPWITSWSKYTRPIVHACFEFFVWRIETRLRYISHIYRLQSSHAVPSKGFHIRAYILIAISHNNDLNWWSIGLPPQANINRLRSWKSKGFNPGLWE